MSDRTIELLLKARDETAQAFRSLDSNVKRVDGSLDGLKKGLGAVGLLLGAREIITYAENAAKAAGDLVDLSTKTRISTEDLSAWDYAAEQSGTTLESLTTSVRFLRKNLYEAADATSESASAFENLGVKVEDLRTMGTVRAFERLVHELALTKDETERTALAVKIFGRGGESVLTLGDDFSRLTQRAKDLGLVIKDDTAQAMDALGDKIDEVKKRSRNLTVEFLTHLGPALMDAAEGTMRILSPSFAKEDRQRRINQIPTPMWGISPFYFNPQRIGRQPDNLVSNPLWYPPWTGVEEERERGGSSGGGRSSWEFGLPTGPTSDLFQPYEDDLRKYSVENIGLPRELWKSTKPFLDEETGKVDVKGMIAAAKAEAKETEDLVRGISERMGDSADEADRVREALARAHNEGAQQLASGMMQFFSIVSGGNSEWMQQLQQIYQLYRTIAEIANAFKLLSTTANITSMATNAAPALVSVPAGKSANITLLVANPQSRMDGLELGRRAAETAEEANRRFR